MSEMNKHPKALPYLFLTEMWERFGFYVVQGLLVLYTTQYFGYSDSDSYLILGTFTALVYISPLIGGYLANNYLGYKSAILWGGFFLILGYALLAMPQAKTLLYPALATIIVGNGLFKPNISSLLGAQYTKEDIRRDAGFTIFYIGINLGALLAGLSSGYIKEYFGWRTSFGLASIGLVIGVITFFVGLKRINIPPPLISTSKQFKTNIILACFISIVFVTLLFNVTWFAEWLLPLVGLACLLLLGLITFRQRAGDRQNMLILTILIISSTVFWMLFLQLFYSANLFVDRLVNKTVLGVHLTTTVFYASESVYIILLGPLFAWSWETLSRNDRNPSPIIKFVLAIIFAGLGFMVLTCSTYFPQANGSIGASWVFFAYLLITIGELLLSPIGLSAVTTLAPPHLVGLMMGVWFVAIGFGGIFAGWIAQLSNVPAHVTDTAAKLAIYQSAFLNYALLAFVVAVLLYAVELIRRHFMQVPDVPNDDSLLT